MTTDVSTTVDTKYRYRWADYSKLQVAPGVWAKRSKNFLEAFTSFQEKISKYKLQHLRTAYSPFDHANSEKKSKSLIQVELKPLKSTSVPDMRLVRENN